MYNLDEFETIEQHEGLAGVILNTEFLNDLLTACQFPDFSKHVEQAENLYIIDDLLLTLYQKCSDKLIKVRDPFELNTALGTNIMVGDSCHYRLISTLDIFKSLFEQLSSEQQDKWNLIRLFSAISENAQGKNEYYFLQSTFRDWSTVDENYKVDHSSFSKSDQCKNMLICYESYRPLLEKEVGPSSAHKKQLLDKIMSYLSNFLTQQKISNPHLIKHILLNCNQDAMFSAIAPFKQCQMMKLTSPALFQQTSVWHQEDNYTLDIKPIDANTAAIEIGYFFTQNLSSNRPASSEPTPVKLTISYELTETNQQIFVVKPEYDISTTDVTQAALTQRFKTDFDTFLQNYRESLFKSKRTTSTPLFKQLSDSIRQRFSPSRPHHAKAKSGPASTHGVPDSSQKTPPQTPTP